MLRSLYTGISALKAHLLRLDVTSNNIANVNTVGFKFGRVTFTDTLSEFLHPASKPDENWGGKDPMQVGTGVKVASIDNIFTQGGLEPTGNVTDMAIEGDGFFIVRDPNGRRFYTRAGMFRLDAMGRLVTPNGLVLLGRIADENGKIISGAKIEDIALPVDRKVPAKATTEVKFACNLDMREKPKNTILKTGIILADALPTDVIDGLYDSLGMKITLSASDFIEFGFTASNGNWYEVVLSYDPSGDGAPNDNKFRSLQGLAEELQSWLQTIPGHAGDTVTVINGVGIQGPPPNGTTFIRWNNTDDVTNARFTATNSFLEEMFENYNGGIAATTSVDTGKFLHTASELDNLIDIYTQRGEWLDLSNGDTVVISGSTGNTNVYTTYNIGAPGFVTLSDLCDRLKDDFDIDYGNVYINAEGQLVIEGDPGTDDKLRVTITEPGNQVFNGWFGSLPIVQDATDVIHQTSFTVYDSLGMPHTVTITFKKDDIVNNLWHWTAELDIGSIREGGSGSITFNADGSLSVFTYDGGASAFKFNPETGAIDPVVIEFFAGTPGKFDGITQMAAPSTTVAISQDGYPMGTLDTIGINKQGEIIGNFTNGVTRTLAQIVLAKFPNNAGLNKEGDSLWSESLNSGTPIVGTAGDVLPSTAIRSGYLEMSNVDLAREFIELIIAQRGFQASSRAFTTSDTMLGELVALKR